MKRGKSRLLTNGLSRHSPISRTCVTEKMTHYFHHDRISKPYLQSMRDDVLKMKHMEVFALVGLNNKDRRTVHVFFENDDQVRVESRGAPNDRIMLLWRKADVAAELEKFLPPDIVRQQILSRVDAMYQAECNEHRRRHEEHRQRQQEQKQQERLARLARYSCEICGRNGRECELLVSVYFRNLLCADCVEADEALNCHKWEEFDWF